MAEELRKREEPSVFSKSLLIDLTTGEKNGAHLGARAGREMAKDELILDLF